MRVLVTRGRPEAERLAVEIAALGHEALIEPLLEMRILPGEPARLIGDLDGVQALLFTSANGLRAFAALSEDRALPVFAVGQSTAEAARKAGFARVESADGNVDDLATLVAARLDPADGALLHGAARQVAGDLQGSLREAGFTLRRRILYEAKAATQLSPEAAAALSGGQVDVVMFFSPRTGETFVRLVQVQSLVSSLVRCHALCLSAAVADKVDVLDWSSIVIAERPNQEALLSSLSRIAEPKPIEAREKGNENRTMDDGNQSGDDGANGAEASNGSGQAPALAIIAAFGGIRPMAAKLGIAVSTVQGWRERAVIPAARHDEVRRVAADQGITLDENLLAASAAAPNTGPVTGPVEQPKAASGATAASAASAASRASSGRTTAQDSTPQQASRSASSEAQPSSAAGDSGSRRSMPPSPPAASAGGFGSNRMGLIVGVGVAAIVLILIGNVLLRSGDEEDLETRIASLVEQVAAQEARLEAQGEQGSALGDLQARLVALEQRPVGDEATVATLADLQDRLDRMEQENPNAGARAAAALQALSGRIDALEADAAIAAGGASALDKRLVELDKRLTALEEAQSNQAAELAALAEAFAASGVSDSVSDASLALALGQLRDALRSSVPYETELALVRRLLAPDDELAGRLDELQAHAASGVPSLAQLKAIFPVVARKAAASGMGQEAEGLLSGVLRRVSEVVTIRPVGEVEGSGVGAHLARAELRLEADDLPGAVAELGAIEASADAALAAWLSDARSRLKADDAIAALGARAVSRLGGANG